MFEIHRQYLQITHTVLPPTEIRRHFGLAHPINVTTVGGDAYTLEDWRHCKDLKLALQKLAPPGLQCLFETVVSI